MGHSIACLAALPLFFLSACHSGTDADAAEAPEEGSLAWIEQRIIERPKDPESYALRARYYEALDSARLAESDWKRAIALDSTAAEWHVALGSLYFTKLRVLDAEQAMRRAARVDPGSVEARAKLSEVYLMQGRYVDAMALANEALRIDPLNGSTYNLKGWIHRLAGDTNLAISSYQTAIERDPQMYDAYVSLGILHAARDNDLALSYYDGAIELRPTSVEALYNKAMYAQEHGRDSLALAIYAQLKGLDSDYPAPYYNTGYILLEHQRRIGEARREFSQAIAKLPTYVQAYYSRGVTYEMDNKLDSAHADYRMAIRLDPQHTDAALGLNRLAAKGVKVQPR
ncbi:MAG TPA: tetratricopeptide repeat protein [Flavobacteriales bacterium]|nr:tetratricopeptide repeat protein [Flavobacteriales bacterium]